MITERGEIWMVNFQPTKGAEIDKIRPAIVMNDNTMGRLPLKFVVPLTDWKSHYSRYLWMVKIVADDDTNGLTKDSAADTFQAKSCSEVRLMKRLGMLGALECEDVAAALALLVGFECP